MGFDGTASGHGASSMGNAGSGGPGGFSSSNPGGMTAHEAGVRGGYKDATGTPGSGGFGGGNAGSISVHDAAGNLTSTYDNKGNLTGIYDKAGNLVGKPTGIGNGMMTTTAGWQHAPGNIGNPYGIGDPRNTNYGGYLSGKRGIQQRAYTGWNDIRTGLMSNMQNMGLPHTQQDAYLSAFDAGNLDSIPDSLMGTNARQGALSALETMNGPVMSALGLTQTPAEAINDLARDLTFSEDGTMGLKPGGVFSRVFGGRAGYSTPIQAGMGVGGMLTGQAMGGIGGKITQALGQMSLTSAFGPMSALSTMGSVLDLAQTAQVAGVSAPNRSNFSTTPEGSGQQYYQQPTMMASAGAAQTTSQPSASTAVSYGGFSPYNGYGYTLI
ncbi:hypothetical protein [Maridesulfovibrio sp.]|uniref:hypothetical protein n=1 Tax=Maridesulfovibrio sp. TaxID=2795000 RepID=UPI0029C9E132|nr:hypothetical protein [Maridesulfovibrio sp.]